MPPSICSGHRHAPYVSNANSVVRWVDGHGGRASFSGSLRPPGLSWADSGGCWVSCTPTAGLGFGLDSTPPPNGYLEGKLAWSAGSRSKTDPPSPGIKCKQGPAMCRHPTAQDTLVKRSLMVICYCHAVFIMVASLHKYFLRQVYLAFHTYLENIIL